MSDADAYMGKTLLVGLTYVDHKGDLIERCELYGTITRITHKGIFFARADGEGEFSLPPDLSSLEAAPPGEYKLRSTGEVVVNPDFLSVWTINAPPPDEPG